MTSTGFSSLRGVGAALVAAAGASARALAQCATETAHVVAADASGGDVFGHTVGVDGDTLVAGAYFDNASGLASGSAYVFRCGAGGWLQEDKLLPSDGGISQRFGWHADVAGDTAVVSAIFGNGLASVSGSAYVFVRSAGAWSEQAKLQAADGAPSDWFGRGIAIDADTVVVGAPQDDDAGSNSGSAYVFVRSGAVWSQQAKLVAVDAAAGDNFGESVAISGDTVVVGSPYDDDTGSNSGSVYVFTRAGNVWTQQAKLTASDADAQDNFGWRVAARGDDLVGGAYKAGLLTSAGPGAAYVFTRGGTSWSEQAKLVAADGADGDQFGWPVAIGPDVVVVGAPSDDDLGSASGSAYVFGRSGSNWSQSAKLLASDGAAGDGFGLGLDTDGATAFVGAHQDDTPAGNGSGSAYVFQLGSGALSYCTAGTTTSGCNAHIDGVGTASASGASNLSIVVGALEGQKQGLVFYGLNGPAAGAWGASPSFLCVKAPTQRTPAWNSGGTSGQCDGLLTLDWNAYLAAHPNALGAPFGAGDVIWMQGWFRDPPSPKTTNLSDALSVVVCP